MNVAAIDLGTNSVRLLVSDGREDIERTAVITRLGARVSRTGHLDTAGIEKTLEVMRRFRESLNTHRVERVRVVATEAARQAHDTESFFDRVHAALGHRPELIDGHTEATFAFTGATAGLDSADGPFCVIDAGGGSTEFSVSGPDGIRAVSVPVGSVRLTEGEILHDPPLPEELTNAIGVAADHLADVERELPEVRDARLVGVAGTILTMAAVEIGMATWDRTRVDRFWLSRAAAEDVFRTLATEPLADRVHNPGVTRDRADVIVAGCCIVVAILRGLQAPGILVRDSDMLDGIVASLLA
ncbi:MAG TPA: hypothetical protein VF855_10200 [Acidimicrobiales bacterium]